MRDSGASTFKPPSQLVCRLSRDDGGGVTSRTAVDSSMGNAGSVWPTAIWPKSKGCMTNLCRNMSDTSILRECNSDHALGRWTHEIILGRLIRAAH